MVRKAKLAMIPEGNHERIRTGAMKTLYKEMKLTIKSQLQHYRIFRSLY